MATGMGMAECGGGVKRGIQSEHLWFFAAVGGGDVGGEG